MKRAPGTLGPRFGIALNLVASVLLAIVVVVNLVAGSYLVVTICAVLLAANLVSIPVNRRVLAIRTEAARPRPDYALIARMEREVYGEAFRHDGAPGDTRAALDAEMDALVDACEKHKPRAEAGTFESLYHLRNERLARRGLCDAGYHVYMAGELGCVYCPEGRR